MNFVETQIATRLRTFVEALTNRQPEHRQRRQRRRSSTRTPSLHRTRYRHQSVHLRCAITQTTTRLRTFVEAPTQRQLERRQRPARRRLSARTPSFHMMSNMTTQYVQLGTKLKVIVWTPNFVKVFNYPSDRLQSFRGALPQVLHPVVTFMNMNDSLL